MPHPEFVPQSEPQRERPEWHVIQGGKKDANAIEPVEEAQIVEARDMTPLELAQERVEQLKAQLAEAERLLQIEETREVIGKEGTKTEAEWFAKGDKPPEELVN